MVKQFEDKTLRTIRLRYEWHEIANFIHRKLVEDGYQFASSEIELRFRFIEEGSPPYKTEKIECNVTITKEIT